MTQDSSSEPPSDSKSSNNPPPRVKINKKYQHTGCLPSGRHPLSLSAVRHCPLNLLPFSLSYSPLILKKLTPPSAATALSTCFPFPFLSYPSPLPPQPASLFPTSLSVTTAPICPQKQAIFLCTTPYSLQNSVNLKLHSKKVLTSGEICV